MSFAKGVHRRESRESSSRNRQQSILSSYSLKQNYREQISESMNSDVSAIAKFSDFKDLLIEAKTIATTEKGMKSMRLFDKLIHLRQISFVLLIFLAFFERPIWCTVDYHDHCRVSPDGKVQIPTSNIPYMNNFYFYPIEILIVSFLTYNRYLKQSFLKNNKQRYWFYCLVTITIIIIIEDIIKAAIESYHVNISLFLKPLYFISFNRVLRKTLKIYIKIIKKAVPIFIIITFNIFFFSVLGRIIFYDQQNDNYFDSLFDTLFNFTVLQTTSNFPDVMMPYYNENRWAPIIFICFLLINLILLLNTVLAVFYSNYKKEMEKDTKKFFFKNKEKMHEYIHKYIVTNPNKALSKQNQQLLQSFMKFHVRGQQTQQLHQSDQFKLSQELENVQDSIPKAFLIRLFKSMQWNIFMACLSFLNFSILYIMVPSIAKKTDSTLWATINLCINMIFFLEQFTQVLIFKRNYLKIKKYYIFDFIISISIITLIICYFITQEPDILPYCMYLICTRMLRFVFILFKFESFKMIFRTVYDFIPLFVNLFGVLIVMFYIFSALGQHIFGGKMTYEFENQINEETNTKYYVLNSFNDTATSLVLLFELLIVNNWMINVQVHQIIMGTKNVRFFFIVWYVISVVICMNIMVAFIIDHLVNKLADSDKINESSIQAYLSQQISDQKHEVQATQSFKFSIFSQKSEDDIFQNLGLTHTEPNIKGQQEDSD